MLEPSHIVADQAAPAASTAAPTPNAPPLRPTVAAIRATLTKSLDADDVAVSKLRSRRVALAHVDVFFQVLAQVPVMASGADFVAGASWLRSYYRQVAAATSEAARGASVLRPDGQLLGGGLAEQHQRMLGDLKVKAAMWDEVVGAAAMYRADMLDRYEAWKRSNTEPEAEMLEYFGGVAPSESQSSPVGTLRIWTAVAAAAVAQAPKQRHPAEARAVYDIASMLSSEAAAMSAGLLGG